MPLTQKVSFKTMLQKANRVQVPKVVRWQFKMDTEQILKVTVNALNVFSDWQTFYARMGRDGRITVPSSSGNCCEAENKASQATSWKWCLNLEKNRGLRSFLEARVSLLEARCHVTWIGFQL